jgi:DNA topoisomerase-1
VFSVGANRAISLLAEKQSRGGRSRGAASVLKDLGEHPTLGGPVTVRAGRYGPYVNHGKVNATLPRGIEPQDVTSDEAVTLLAAKEAKPATRGRRSSASGTRRRAPAAKGRSRASGGAK